MAPTQRNKGAARAYKSVHNAKLHLNVPVCWGCAFLSLYKTTLLSIINPNTYEFTCFVIS
jgi:hypothetical protein